ncbi:MAG: type II secretion system major pseudopilin GspG [Candidatus Omnitrophica bacterium]|nr:type II secretion system major pseudopilin GspG [Candidatus Omnitrophota bacterium]
MMRRTGHEKRRWRSGFTLVELLIVVTILGILVAMVVPRLAGRTEQARRARAESDVKGSIPLALDLFEVDTGGYPTAEEGLGILRTAPPDASARNWHGPYLKQEPMDPWGHPYRYLSPGVHNPQDYDLFSLGPDGTEGTSDDIGNWSQGGK